MEFTPKEVLDATVDILNRNEGEYYSIVMARGAKYIRDFYFNPVEEINEKRFPTMTPMSYSHIPEYYTVPINREYVDTGPVIGNPYSRYSRNTRPKWANEDQTPELLLEPFQDDLCRSSSTMADMIDMHYKKYRFEIIHDDDVIYVYKKLSTYIQTARNMDIPKGADDFAEYLNKIIDFLSELKWLFDRACKRRGIYMAENGLMQFLVRESVAC